jgi:6-phosphogluconolactonase
MLPTVIVDDRARLVKTFVDLVEAAAAEAIGSRGRFAMAITGGGDALVFLPPLTEAHADWARTDVFWGDDRAVAPDHDDSNYGQAKAAWLDRASIPPDRVHRMHGERPDLDAAARDYEATLTGTLGATPIFDFFFLGVGPDGHVCSLFPGHPLLEERTRLAVAIHDSPKPPPRRITLTMPALTQSRLIVVTAEGQRKAEAMRAAIDDPASPLPVARVLREAPRVVVLLDPAAARLLRQ